MGWVVVLTQRGPPESKAAWSPIRLSPDLWWKHEFLLSRKSEKIMPRNRTVALRIMMNPIVVDDRWAREAKGVQASLCLSRKSAMDPQDGVQTSRAWSRSMDTQKEGGWRLSDMEWKQKLTQKLEDRSQGVSRRWPEEPLRSRGCFSEVSPCKQHFCWTAFLQLKDEMIIWKLHLMFIQVIFIW